MQQIVNAFLTKTDASEHIKRVTANDFSSTGTEGNATGTSDATGVPPPPARSGGFDFASLIGGLGGLLNGGGGGGNKAKVSRAPTYRE